MFTVDSLIEGLEEFRKEFPGAGSWPVALADPKEIFEFDSQPVYPLDRMETKGWSQGVPTLILIHDAPGSERLAEQRIGEE